ncbi:MAG: hypothetical protein RLZZ271_1497 [Pseudomonadota bacterium]|jgi:hypothetical protein
MDTEAPKSGLARPLAQHKDEFYAWAAEYGYGPSGRTSSGKGERLLRKLCARHNPFAISYRDNRGKVIPVEPDRSILKVPRPPKLAAPDPNYRGLWPRVTNCHRCKAFPLDSLTTPACSACGWMLCSCGGCRCNYSWR